MVGLICHTKDRVGSSVTVHSPQGMGFTGVLGWTGSCKLDLLQLL